MKTCRRRLAMDKIVIFAVTICYVLEICGKIYGEEMTDDEMKNSASANKFESDIEKRGSPGGMWFGPRLGKRSQPPLETLDHSRIVALQQLLEAMLPALNEEHDRTVYGPTGTKRRFTPRLGRDSSEQEIMGPSKNVDFIPRLGRELPPAILRELLNPENEANWLNLYGRAIADNRRPTFTESRIPPFAPRLGRQQLWPFYGNSRYTRSTENEVGKVQKTQSSKS